ncbi:MAG: GDP-mannose 4,6-dehydratase [Anaerolineales bacterium]
MGLSDSHRTNLPTQVLITGGAGFIGSHLAEALLERGHRVTIIDDLSTGRFDNIAHLADHPRFHFAIESITNEVVMDRLVSECSLIFHLAAAVGVQLIVESPVHTIETNIMGTEAVLKAALRYRAKVLIASTSEVYGKGNAISFREDDDVVLGPTSRSRWSYAASKMVDEFLALAYYREKGLPIVVFRLFNTVGPRQTGRYGMVIPRFVGQALRKEPLSVYGDGGQSRCFLHVHDAVEARSLTSAPWKRSPSTTSPGWCWIWSTFRKEHLPIPHERKMLHPLKKTGTSSSSPTSRPMPKALMICAGASRTSPGSGN